MCPIVSSLTANGTNVYVNPDLEMINPTNNVLVLVKNKTISVVE